MTRTSLTREQKFAIRLLSFRDQRLKMWKLGVKTVRDKFMPTGIRKHLIASLFPPRGEIGVKAHEHVQAIIHHREPPDRLVMQPLGSASIEE
jgi:hypothetical protein